jgi:hypothetical protein
VAFFFQRKDLAVSLFAKLFCGVAILLMVAAGCSSDPKLVFGKGKVLYKEQPLKVKPRAQVVVTFIPVDKGDKPIHYECDFNPADATFEAGYRGKGLPVGKYRISVEQKMPPNTEPPDVRKMNEMFAGDKSPIIRELKDEEPIIIDLSKPEG